MIKYNIPLFYVIFNTKQTFEEYAYPMLCNVAVLQLAFIHC